MLSACETGFGKYEEGEGVMSLGRSFMYAGIPSVVVSLWQVNDYSTSIIMENFYANLSEGMNKDSALQQAKISYLKEAKGILANPAFWSPFIQIGNSSPLIIEKKEHGYLYPVIIFCGFITLFLIALGFYRKKSGTDPETT